MIAIKIIKIVILRTVQLYQFVLFAESVTDVGDKIQKAQEAHDIAIKRLSTGRGNLVRRSMELQKLGAKTKKKMVEELRANAEEDAFCLEEVNGANRPLEDAKLVTED